MDESVPCPACRQPLPLQLDALDDEWLTCSSCRTTFSNPLALRLNLQKRPRSIFILFGTLLVIGGATGCVVATPIVVVEEALQSMHFGKPRVWPVVVTAGSCTLAFVSGLWLLYFSYRGRPPRELLAMVFLSLLALAAVALLGFVFWVCTAS